MELCMHIADVAIVYALCIKLLLSDTIIPASQLSQLYTQ